MAEGAALETLCPVFRDRGFESRPLRFLTLSVRVLMELDSKRKAYLRLHLAKGVGHKRLRRLIEAAGSPEEVIDMSLSQLERVFTSKDLAERIYKNIKGADPDSELEKVERLGARLIFWGDQEYPYLLSQIPDPPLILYTRGSITGISPDSFPIAIVGTRMPSHYGIEQAERFGYLLSNLGATVVSGLARGIDTAAHKASLSASGRTVAVLGCGIDRVYPPENDELVSRIIEEDGAILSEYPIGTEPLAGNFPSRNRIIAGLSYGILLVEAPENSGALITARLALEYNREVFAIPGPIDRRGFFGSNKMIQKGEAKLVLSVDDIVEEFIHILNAQRKRRPNKAEGQEERKDRSGRDDREDTYGLGPSDRELLILDAIGADTVSIDTICERSGLAVSEVMASLTMLEIRGLIFSLPGGRFARR